MSISWTHSTSLKPNIQLEVSVSRLSPSQPPKSWAVLWAGPIVFILELARKIGPHYKGLSFLVFSSNYPLKVAVVKAGPLLLPPEAACLGSTPRLGLLERPHTGKAMKRDSPWIFYMTCQKLKAVNLFCCFREEEMVCFYSVLEKSLALYLFWAILPSQKLIH